MDDLKLPRLPDQYHRPGKLREEFYVDDVLRLAAIPGEVLAARRTPVRPALFPPRIGMDHTPPTISDVIATDRWGNQMRSWRSGFPVDQRTAEGGFSGTLRNSFSASV